MGRMSSMTSNLQVDQIIDMSSSVAVRGITLSDTCAAVRMSKRIRRLVYERHPKFHWMSDDILPLMSTLQLICSNWGSSYIDDWTTVECFSSLAYAFIDTDFDIMRMMTNEVLCCDDGALAFRKNCIEFLMRFEFHTDVKDDDDALYYVCKLIKTASECESLSTNTQ